MPRRRRDRATTPSADHIPSLGSFASPVLGTGTGTWTGAAPRPIANSAAAQVSWSAASTSRIASRSKYTALRSAITPPRMPPSVAPRPMLPMWRFALRMSKRSLMIDQKPDTRTALAVLRWKNTSTAIGRG